jgi:adenosylmethionine---8-amino-7-oxononanoate aminotransferase
VTFSHTLTDMQFDSQHVWHPYASCPPSYENLLVSSAQGCHLTLESGAHLIDGMSSWWSAIHGYCHPKLTQAMHTQIDTMPHVMFGGLTHQPAINLSKLLCDITPKSLDYVFFSDSGSVAVEVAIKMAIQYWAGKKQPNKRKLLTPLGGYHGDTFAAMSVCDPVNGMHHLFQHHLMPQIFAPRPSPAFDESYHSQHLDQMRALCEKEHHHIAAIILEPIVQGAGGMRFYSPQYLHDIRELCDEFNLLLIADEIATGFGRTGKLFACEHANISPDILCLGKALTGGNMSLAATLCNEKVRQGIHDSDANVLMHGPTFMANPLACAVSLASTQLLISSPWHTHVTRIESELKQGLDAARAYSNVEDVRCLGAIGVIELKKEIDNRHILPILLQQGVWLRPFGKLLYTMPPYIANTEQIKLITDTMLSIVDFEYSKH